MELEQRAPRRNPGDISRAITQVEWIWAGQKRDGIAQAMWNQYIEHMQQQG
jgi:hypothetical protein